MTALLALVSGIAALVVGLALVVDRFGQADQAHPSAAIVMLGARVHPGGVASAALRARAQKAAELYRRGLAPLVIFTGGVGDHGPSEAQVAKVIALGAGVPESATLLEEESHSTLENARFTAKLLRARGVWEVILVSDPYHLLRARQCFRLHRIAVLPSPAPLSERNIRPTARLYWTLREAVAILASPGLW